MGQRAGWILAWITVVALALIGLTVIAAGAWLVAGGGSPYYLLVGSAMSLTAIYLIRRPRFAFSIYALLVVATLIHALAGTGLDWSRLLPRGQIVFLIGAWLLILSLLLPQPDRRGRIALSASLALAATVGIASMLSAQHAVTDQQELARLLPAPQGIAPPDNAGMPDAEWQARGRSQLGDRWSPIGETGPVTIT